MRKRTRGRGVHSRGGRGGSRTVANPAESPKMINYIQIHQRPRQSPSYIRSNRGRSKDKDNRLTNLGSNGGILGNLVKAYGMSVSAETLDGNGNALSGDYYLHKKFKKVTTTTSGDNGEMESVVEHLEHFVGKNGINGLSSDNIPISKSKFSSSSPMNLVNTSKSSQGFPGLINDFTESMNRIIKNGTLPASTINNHTSVYKPKFRVSRAAGEPDSSCTNGSSQSDPIAVISSTSTVSQMPPARITGDRRLDRQSLDDRISKIIDENQSILSTWPEHLSKRLKSQTQGQSSRQSGGGSQLPTPSPSPTQQQRVGGMNPLVIMSGGTTTEITPGVNSATRTFAFDVPLQSPVLDLAYSPRKKKFSFDMPPISSFSKYNLTSETASLPSDAVCGGNGIGDLSDSSCSATSATNFVLPKKRRRLSPPPTIFCGGEVSELPVKNSSSASVTAMGATRNGFQDVNVTVRVSNCGPSGAKVTVRTNDSSLNILQSRAQALEFNRLIIEDNGVTGNSNSGSSFNSYRSQFFSPEKRSLTFGRAPERDFFPLDLNMKSVKPRGRPPRKRKHLNGVELEASNPLIPKPTLSPSIPLDLNMKSKGPDLQKSSSSPPNGNPGSSLPRNNGMMTADCGNANKSGLNFGTDHEGEKQLFLQTSMPNPKRPTFLALKPSNPLPKALTDPGVLPSPETPRGAKAYNQMHINGHAYTYLGFKISTRPSYTCLFKPQPMFIPQETDAKLSMYSNWQARPKDPNAGDCNISTNNSSVNGRKSPQFMYVSAKGKNSNTVTVNSPDGQAPLLFTPNESELKIGNMLLDDPVSSSSSNPLPLSSSPNFISKNNEFDAQTQAKRSCPSPLDQGNSSSSSGHSNSNNKPKWSSYNGSKYQHGSSKKKAYGPGTIALSSSESSSADESNYSFSKSEFERRSFNRKNSVGTDGEEHFTMRLHSHDGKEGTLPSSSRSSPDFSRFDNPRVKIMEGGFESNEDYTYIRGRGRGRYVCEACGIRCKKPSMLRKHLKTHTDLRPYSCKLCNFSFKTKGNLTKHQKSKSHHKKCLGLGIHPNSSRSLAMSGPIFDSNNTSDEDDSMDDDDDIGGDSDNSNDEDGDGSAASCGDTDADHFEKEIAQSLLDLSHLSRFPRSEGTPEHNKVKSGEESPKQRISSYLDDIRGVPVSSKASSTFNLKSGSINTLENGVVSKPSSSGDVEVPIDLSVKCKKDNVFPKRTNGIVKAMGIVGEAQRWEPEEAFLLNGILNLKKVRNTVIHEEENSSEEVLPSRPVVLPAAKSPEIKVEVTESTQLACVSSETSSIADSFEYQIKKKCRPGSADINEATTSTTSFQIPLSLSPKPGTSSPANIGNGANTISCQNQKSRFHQPWLSPQGSCEETITESITPRRERTESLNSCITGESSNSESIGCRDEMEALAETTGAETSPLKSTILEKPVGLCSPNASSKSFSGFASIKPQAEFRQPSGAFIKDEGKAECNICGKAFTRASQLNLHMNIHFLERPFRCDPCGVSFRTKGHLIKHRRSSSHDCKVYLTEAWGVANEENPRPFKCPDCKIAFRIHGHLAKHLRSKMHIMRMECLGKLPFGIYFEMEKSGLNLNEIDTTSCDTSLVSCQNVAKKIYGDSWMERLTLPIEDPV